MVWAIEGEDEHYNGVGICNKDAVANEGNNG